ncbi:MAG: hypothetical protein MJE77_11140 [Proteobacteria bacterium]|nr:hypothetical protein [Pseudomonadota bacterium]
MEPIETMRFVYNGHQVPTYRYRGKPCWRARDVGMALGYEDDGRAFVRYVMSRWDELTPGVHYDKLKGVGLHEFKAQGALGVNETPTPMGVGVSETPTRTPSVVVLYESSMHGALLKTTKPAGRAMRRVFIDKVMPQLARDGRYCPDRTVMDGRVVDRHDTPSEAVTWSELLELGRGDVRFMLRRMLEVVSQDAECIHLLGIWMRRALEATPPSDTGHTRPLDEHGAPFVLEGAEKMGDPGRFREITQKVLSELAAGEPHTRKQLIAATKAPRFSVLAVISELLGRGVLKEERCGKAPALLTLTVPKNGAPT